MDPRSYPIVNYTFEPADDAETTHKTSEERISQQINGSDIDDEAEA